MQKSDIITTNKSLTRDLTVYFVLKEDKTVTLLQNAFKKQSRKVFSNFGFR